MTELLCNQDAYLREFDATVVEVSRSGVELDRTAFYPGGGGQPSDTGVLQADGVEYAVKGLSRSGGKLVHETDSGAPLAGMAVHGVLDWERRFRLMRTHTALHILCGVVWRDFGAQVTGGDMKLMCLGRVYGPIKKHHVREATIHQGKTLITAS